MQYKLRTIVGSTKTGKVVKGLTIPEEIALFFEECHFKIEMSGTCIVAYSGTSMVPTKEEISEFNLEELRV